MDELKVRALQMAIGAGKPGEVPETTLRRARLFEAHIKGESDEKKAAPLSDDTRMGDVDNRNPATGCAL